MCACRAEPFSAAHIFQPQISTSENDTSAMTAHVLENHLLQVTVLPESGGKISSLRSIRTGEEFLLPHLQPATELVGPERKTITFDQGDLGGFDECLPSVAPCGSIEGEPPVPDHGDLWRHPWAIESSSSQSITLATQASSRPLRITRAATLEGDTLVLDYEIENVSGVPATWLWSAHPLLKVEAGDRIYLPRDIAGVKVEYTSTEDFAQSSHIGWPVAQSTSGSSIDLSVVPHCDGTTAHKLFARMEGAGITALHRARLQQGIALHFDSSKLPYLGIWISAGAWPQSGPNRQYTVALEPTTSQCDSLADAVNDGSACRLAGGDRRHWRVAFELLGASAPYLFSGSNSS